MLSEQSSDGKRHLENIEKKFSFSGKLNTVGKIDKLPDFRYRWNTNEEVFTILTSFQEHEKWTANEVKIRPQNGSQFLYNRVNIKTRAYHNDEYYWKTRKNSKSSRVDHSSLRIMGIECIYCSYVHSALVPTFHRRCYWLLENPNIVLVHYLNLPDKSSSRDNLVNSLLPYRDMHDQELLNQLQPILRNSGDTEDNNQKIANINIEELISEVKSYKEPTSPNIGDSKTLATDKLRVTSKARHKVPPKKILIPEALGSTEKCSNCNRHFTARREEHSLDSYHLNTNVAVTINKQNSIQQRVKAANMIKQNNTKLPLSSSKQTHKSFVFNVDFDAAKMPSETVTASESLQPEGSSREQLSTSNWGKDCNDNVVHSVVPASGFHEVDLNSVSEDMSTDGSLKSTRSSDEQFATAPRKDPADDLICSSMTGNSYHGSPEPHAAMSAQKQCKTANDQHLVLDYDGLDLIESNPSYNDVTKALDMNLFDSDLLECLPDYLSDVNELPSDVRKSYYPDVVSAMFPTLRDLSGTSDVPTATPSATAPIAQQSLFESLTEGVVSGNLNPSPFAEMVSTDCHTFDRLTPTSSESNSRPPNGVGGGVTPITNHRSPTFQPPSEAKIVNYLPPAINPFPGIPQNSSSVPLHESNIQVPGNDSGDRITEFSPEWSYCDGKTKVLVLGHWSHQGGSYSCLFDGSSVPATLIQSGVLRCFCPPHDASLVSLQVAWNGFIVSNTCVFEYRRRENAANSLHDWLGVSDVQLKKLLFEKMEKLEAVLNIGAEDDMGDVGISVEDRIIRICEVLFSKPSTGASTDLDNGSKGLSLLHVAAGLGYTKLIHLLRHYACARQAAENEAGCSDVVLPVTECLPLKKDSLGCTPLMWACWRGHQDSALLLLAWEPSSYDECDSRGCSAKVLAEEMGHLDLAQRMEQFICCKNKGLSILDGLSPLPSLYPLMPSLKKVPASPMSEHSSPDHWVDVEMASITSEDRPNTLGKVLVEIRTLIQEAEQRARSTQSPLHSPDDTTPFSIAFGGFSDDKDSSDLQLSEARAVPRTSRYDTLSVDSNSPIYTPGSRSPSSPALRGSPQPPSTDTSEFEEFLSKPRKFLEKDFSELTLTDIEQQELLHAAKVIQIAYRQFKIRKKQHVDELKAAVLIQSYYRRYKQFALYKKITKAAVLIQNSYRAYREHEQFKKSRQAAAIIQNYFRHYRKRKQKHAEEDAFGKRLGTKYRKSSYGK